MRSRTDQKIHIDGPAGRLEVVISDPGDGRTGYAIVAHPHPLHGGTLDNKVVQTLSKSFYRLGYAAVRFNFRGVGESEGVFDEGPGEIEDLLAVERHAQQHFGDVNRVLGGFSFGSFVAAAVAAQLEPCHLVLIAPAVGRFPIGEVPKGALVVHGEDDDLVLLADVMDWARPQKLPVVVFPGVGHFFHGALIDLQNLVTRYCRD
ncbi:MAG: alpha/beta fold hydrolase [Betaproteobacteria bacterium]|nr:MAG: alpha/beta fold hydrolase [Betaproteobacteria bacterium]